MKSHLAQIFVMLLSVATADAQVQGFHQKISATAGGFDGVLTNQAHLGQSVLAPGDLNGDGVPDLVVGEPGNVSVTLDGALWFLFLRDNGWVDSSHQLTPVSGGFDGSFFRTGTSIGAVGDIDGNGTIDLVLGNSLDDAEESEFEDCNFGVDCDDGAVLVLRLNADLSVAGWQRISDLEGGLAGNLSPDDHFGTGLAGLGDLDGDGVGDVAVGAPGDDDGALDAGAVWILFLNADGTVKAEQKISRTEGGLGGGPQDGSRFGHAIANLGDIDGDGVVDLAVGAPEDDSGGQERGAVWVLFLNSGGTVKSEQRISSTDGGFGGALTNLDRFGSATAAMGDINGDGTGDLAVGAPYDFEGGYQVGAFWLLFLDSDGTVKDEQKVSPLEGGFQGIVDESDRFGTSLAALGDVDGDGITDLAVGAPRDDDGGANLGAVWVLFRECSIEAQVASRNAGANPPSYTASPPVLGGTFDGQIDLTTTGHSFAAVLGYGAPASFTLGNGATLLIDPTHPDGEVLGLPLLPGPAACFGLQVPDDLSLCGLEVFTQAAHIGGVQPFALSNAQDIVVGL